MSTEEQRPGATTRLDDEGITRRKMLRVGGSGLVVVGGASWLAACGGGSSSSSGTSAASSASPASTGTPKKGGTLRVGASGGGDNDTLDGQNVLSNPDFGRGVALFDPLVDLDHQGKVRMVLAESIEPNKDATVWTIKLRPNVKSHDGKDFTADDVLYSLRRIESKKFPGAISFGPIDLKAAKVVDKLTLRVPFKEAYAIFPEGLTLAQTRMVPRGFDPKKPIGTGPYKYVSFTPGRESTFVRHEEYWDPGKPYLDKLVITNFADETSQVNALQAGQVDAIWYLSSTSVAAAKGAGAQVIVSKTAAWGPFTMRVDKAPFTDVRVRQALKLVVDRPQMNEQVFGGLGTVANDVWGSADPAFDKSLPQRNQDLEQAKSLLKAAGQPDLQLALITTPNAPGQIQAAQVFATQAKAAGVQTKITNQTPTQYFANSYLKVPFSQDYWPTQPYLVSAGQAVVKGAPFSATHQADPAYDALYTKATKTVDAAQRTELIHQMLKFDYEKGGDIIPYYFPVIDAVSSKVKGVPPTVTGLALGGFNWKRVWMES